MTQRELSVLIIDDRPEEHDLYCDFLEDDREHGFRFFHAYDGAEGEKLYNDHAIDCILLDYRLPDKDGLEVLKSLAAKGSIVPVIMLTGEGSEMVAVTAMKLGSQDYLPKQSITSAALRRMVLRATERSEILKQLDSYRQDLERSNADLERFANVVAHDLKAPLRAITQHLVLVREAVGDGLDPKAGQSMAFAVDGAARLRSLIDAVFEYSRVGFRERNLTVIDGNRLIEEVRASLSSVIEETGAEITHDALPAILADHTQMLQLLQNLIANAIKFCECKPHIHVGAQLEGEHWVFSVRDNGIGIAPEFHQKIFTIFRRLHTEEEYSGTGTGLAICERVVHNHHGRIWVDSAPGKGATFCFTLPVMEQEPQKEAAYG